MRFFGIICAFAMLSGQAPGQRRAGFASRFGSPRSEIFLLPGRVQLTATYDSSGAVCAYRIETPDNTERVAPDMIDERFWIDSQKVTRLIADLVPEATRRGQIHSKTLGLRVGEWMLIESDDAVQITRVQRSRRLSAPDTPAADRLVKITWKRPECESTSQVK